jgi:hypothetical protein
MPKPKSFRAQLKERLCSGAEIVYYVCNFEYGLRWALVATKLSDRVMIQRYHYPVDHWVCDNHAGLTIPDSAMTNITKLKKRSR